MLCIKLCFAAIYCVYAFQKSPSAPIPSPRKQTRSESEQKPETETEETEQEADAPDSPEEPDYEPPAKTAKTD